MDEKIGFVGLGLMGAPMAGNLLRAGYEIVVYNRSRGAVDGLVREGAESAGGPAEVAARSGVVITMLPGPAEVREVVAGESGLLEGAGEGMLVIDMSTSSPVLARELDREARERGISIMDAPVSGADVGARAGTLSIMAGGEERDFERARPLFEVLGETVVHTGESGTGQTVKAANQIVVALIIEAVCEALVLGLEAGVDADRMIEILSTGLAGSRILEVKGEKLLGGDFTPGGKVASHHKDLGIALETGREYGAPLPATAMVAELFGALKARGMGGHDHSALLKLLQSLSGHALD